MIGAFVSSEKEFNWTDSENFKCDAFQAFFDHEFNFDDRNQKRQNRQSFETAWNYQQAKIDAKDKEISELKKKVEKLESLATYYLDTLADHGIKIRH